MRPPGSRATVLVEVGSEFVEVATPTVASPASPDLYLTLDLGFLSAGKYTAIVSYFVGTDQANTSYWFDVFANGAPSVVGAAEGNIGRAGSQIPVTAELEFTWPGAELVLTHMIAKAAGPGIITFHRSLQRVLQKRNIS